MTRQTSDVTLAFKADKSALLSLVSPVDPPRHLAAAVAAQLADRIHQGLFEPGARLPTEHAMMAAFGVSRTVVREAVAALRAEGLVLTRQGSGAFVAAEAMQRPFRIEMPSSAPLDHVLHVLELRRAVEIEAAELAALRGSAPAHRRIQQAQQRFVKAIVRGETGVTEDFAFHRAIGEATGNPQFLRFLDFLGGYIIPRQTIRMNALDGQQHGAYLKRLIGEHAAICDAIQAKSPKQARRAMRLHLMRSSERYLALRRQLDPKPRRSRSG